MSALKQVQIVIKNRKMKLTFKITALIVMAATLFQCNSNPKENSSQASENEPETQTISTPDFNADSAFGGIEKQLSFGTRVPGTPGHKACGDWMVKEMKRFGLEVTEQPFDAFSYKGEKRPARNIIAAFNPAATKRVILAAHWDTRELADQDDEKQTEAIPGANDGGSGVAVLMEIARSIAASNEKPIIGIDFIFFDAEDGGAPDDFKGNPINEYGGYLLGSEYWSQNPHKENYSAFYGVLLDMVGAKNATFLKEQASMQVAPSIVNKIWQIASSAGFGNIFIQQNGPGITDDHLPVIINRKIPMVDIIDLKSGNKTFFDHWHTHDDNIHAIDKGTLEAVGETLIRLLYQEGGVS